MGFKGAETRERRHNSRPRAPRFLFHRDESTLSRRFLAVVVLLRRLSYCFLECLAAPPFVQCPAASPFVWCPAAPPSALPQVGIRFKSAYEAWQFWLAYGGRTGFDVRKRYSNVSPFHGKVTSCRFVCSNEGLRRKGQTNRVTKCFRAESRIDCKARISLILDQVAGNYEVNDVVLEHNHFLHLPETRHLMASQRKISELQAFEIETADDSGIRPKTAHELVSRQVGGPLNLSYTCRDRKNYLQSKRHRDLAFGQAGSMLKYFHDKIVENPAFQYALQLDCEEHITNIFWADAKMILDYAHFGDVVTFDTTFGTNKEYRPFGIFLGLNQFRETTVFGVALLFDEI